MGCRAKIKMKISVFRCTRRQNINNSSLKLDLEYTRLSYEAENYVIRGRVTLGVIGFSFIETLTF